MAAATDGARGRESPLEIARRELRRGRQPIPVPFRRKFPPYRDWQKLILTEEQLPAHFDGQPQNVGVLNGAPSGDQLDVDLDCPFARAIAPAFLPETGCAFGRRSSPVSHLVFVGDPPVPTARFVDPTKPADDERVTIAELRSTGTQTIWPGSTHPSGEPIEWHSDGEPGRVDGVKLKAAVGKVAAAALLARHWPGQGGRQDAALALAGGLLRAGWTEDASAKFIYAVAGAAGDEEAEKRARTGEYTANALGADRRATGWPTLADLIGDTVVSSAREWLGVRRVDSARSSGPYDDHVGADGEGRSRPEIDAGDHDFAAVSRRGWDALTGANDPPWLFRFGGLPVRVAGAGDDGAAVLQPLTTDRLRHELARVAFWFKQSEKRGAVASEPPVSVVRDMLAAPAYPLPPLVGIVEAPAFAPDGTLPARPGYHAAGRTYFAPQGCRIPPVPDRPTPADVAAARDLLLSDLLSDFPFAGDGERANMVALLLLPFLRGLVDGPTPLHLIEKPTAGTGATLLADAVARIATGHAVGTMTEGRDEDEWRKRITAKLKASPPVLLIDNLRRRLDSAAVSSALTSTLWEDRLLGASEMVRVPIRCAWIATGNNPGLSSEITRRTVRIRLDAKQERPWERRGFRHDPLLPWVMANRGPLIAACLTLGSGRACGGFAIADSAFCFAHDPGAAGKRADARRRGGKAGRVVALPESDLSVRTLGDVLALVEATINDVRTGRVDVRIANSIGVLANVAARTIQVADVEQRLAALESVLEPDRLRSVARRRG